jgi:hypothetical protein
MVLMGKQMGKNHLEEPGLDKKILLKLFVRKWFGGMHCIEMVKK